MNSVQSKYLTYGILFTGKQYFLHKESCQYRWLDNVIFHFLSYSFNPCQATAVQPRFTWKLKDTSKSFSPYLNFTVNLYLYLGLTKVHQNLRTARSCPAGLGLQGRGKCNNQIGGILFAIENLTQWELDKNAEHLTSTSRLAVWVLVCAHRCHDTNKKPHGTNETKTSWHWPKIWRLKRKPLPHKRKARSTNKTSTG